MTLAVLAVITCAAVLYGFWRAGELRVAQTLCAGLGGFFLATSRVGPDLVTGVVDMYWWVNGWRV